MKTAILNHLKQNSFVKRRNLLTHLQSLGYKTTDRQMRKEIESLIIDDEICVMSSEQGYKLIVDYSEVVKAKSYLAKKAISIQIRYNCIVSNFRKLQKEDAEERQMKIEFE